MMTDVHISQLLPKDVFTYCMSWGAKKPFDDIEQLSVWRLSTLGLKSVTEEHYFYTLGKILSEIYEKIVLKSCTCLTLEVFPLCSSCISMLNPNLKISIFKHLMSSSMDVIKTISKQIKTQVEQNASKIDVQYLEWMSGIDWFSETLKTMTEYKTKPYTRLPKNRNAAKMTLYKKIVDLCKAERELERINRSKEHYVFPYSLHNNDEDTDGDEEELIPKWVLENVYKK